MKFFLMFFSVVIASGTIMAQHSEVRKLGRFSSIRVIEGIEIYLKQGSEESARVEISGGGSLSNVVTAVAGNTLEIHLQNIRGMKNAQVQVFVTYQSLQQIIAASASHVYGDGVLKAEKLHLEVSSAADIDLDLNISGTLSVSASSAGDIELEGIVNEASFVASSAGEIDAYELKAQVVQAESSSGASIKLFVEKEFQGNASSGGMIRFRGNPERVNTDSSSGGSVRKSSH